MTVCVVPSRFVNVTRAPAWTLILDGLNAKFMMMTDGGGVGSGVGVGRGVGTGVGRGVETTGCGVGAGVSTGVGETVGDGVELAAAGEGDGGGEEWLVACTPQAVSKHATTIARTCRIKFLRAKNLPRLIPAEVTTV